MTNPNHRFASREEVERWIEDCIEGGMSTQLIYAIIQKKFQELTALKSHFLLKRREALVSGNTKVATELHQLMNECDAEMRWFSEATGSVAETPAAKERIIDPETKEELMDKLTDRLN